MTRGDIHDRYFYELGKSKHYEMKCHKYREVNQEKYEKYWPKYLDHRKMAAKYYYMMKENADYKDFLEDESIFADSGYFSDSCD